MPGPPARDTGLQVLHEVSRIVLGLDVHSGAGVPVGTVGPGALLQIFYILPLAPFASAPPDAELKIGLSPGSNELLASYGSPVLLADLTENIVGIAPAAVNDLLHAQTIYATLSSSTPVTDGAVAVVVSFTPIVG